ncbi:MAG TPA: PIG-L family deacetylase [Acidobacteriaceae bacterium]
MRVLAIGAHPDDLELQCAGTMAKYALRGDHVIMAVAMSGDCGSATLPKAEIAAIRGKEARASAAVIGAEFLAMGNYSDGFLFSTEQTRLDFLNVIRQSRPDVILTHSPNDYHPDHRMVAQIVSDVRIMITVPNIKTEAPPYDKLPEIYFFDTMAGVDFVPQNYVDISTTFEVKKKMLACHKSQSSWLEEQYNMTYLDFIDCVGRFRGLQCGVQYAECFQVSSTWPKQVKGVLLP